MFVNDFSGFNRGNWNTPTWGQNLYGYQAPNLYGWNIPTGIYGFGGSNPYYTTTGQVLGHYVPQTLPVNTGQIFGQYLPQTLPMTTIGGIGNGFVNGLNTLNTLNTLPFNNTILGQGGVLHNTIGQGFTTTPFFGNINSPFLGCR